MAARPYQGYPYTNPHVTDAPSVDAATASRWNDLPRRPVQPPTQAISVIYVDVPEEGSEVSTPNVTGKKSDPEPDPVIYIDVPESGDSDVAGPASPEPEPEYVQDTIFYDPFENRRIDRQKSSDTPDTDSDAGSSRPARPPHPARPDTLDLPGASGSSGYASSTYNSIPDFLSKEASIYGRDDGFILSPLPLSSMQHPEPPPAYSEIHTPVIHTPQTTEETPSTPAEPPRTIVITQGSELIHCEPSVGLPSPYRKVLLCQHCGRNVNTLVIWQTGFMTHVVAIILLVCVYLVGFHKDKLSRLNSNSGSDLNQEASIGLPSPNRKQLYCQHCGHRVHTLVIRETGIMTHVIASILYIFMLWPFVVLVYCTNVFKYKNHYCPNCNKKIGHEMPILCVTMTYESTDSVIRTGT